MPLFDYFQGEGERRGAFRVLVDGYVTNDSGTGIVHQAPAFGEDDYRVCMAAGVIRKGESVPCPVDDNGRFTLPVAEFIGQGVKQVSSVCELWKGACLVWLVNAVVGAVSDEDKQLYP